MCMLDVLKLKIERQTKNQKSNGKSGFVFSLPRDRIFAQPSLACGLGFWIREIFYSFERKMQELLDLFQKNRKQLDKQMFSVFCQFLQRQ